MRSRGVGGEIQLTDALDAVLAEEEMYALVVDPADGFDTGTVEAGSRRTTCCSPAGRDRCYR